MGIKFTPADSSQPPGSGTGGQPPTPSAECNKKLGITDIKSTGDRPTFSASNAIYNDPTGTKWWSTSVANPSITLNLGAIKQVCKVEIIWGDGTHYRFTISFSTDNNTFTNVTQLTRTGTSTTQAEPYTFPVTQAQYVKITITQSVTTYAQISDISVFSN
jgi:F5/8 type C domain